MFGKNKEPEFQFNLGDRVKDTITSFTGIVIARTQWLNNCNTYTVKPTILKDGVPQDGQHFDEPQLKIVEEKVHKESRSTGGPERAVSQTNRWSRTCSVPDQPGLIRLNLTVSQATLRGFSLPVM